MGPSDPIQPLILQLGKVGSSQLRLLPRSRPIGFQTFTCTAVSTEHQPHSWPGRGAHSPKVLPPAEPLKANALTPPSRDVDKTLEASE